MKKSGWSKLVWNKAFHYNFWCTKWEVSTQNSRFPKLNALSEVHSHESPSNWSELSLTPESDTQHKKRTRKPDFKYYLLTWHYFNRSLLHPLSTQNFEFQLRLEKLNKAGEKVSLKGKLAYFALACVTFSMTKTLLSAVSNFDKLIAWAKTSHIRSMKKAVDSSLFDGVFCSEKIWVQALSG